MLHQIYYANKYGADYYMIVPHNEISGTVENLKSLDYEIIAVWQIEEK
tara:strand:+ start:64 stop:207 length:144 start_codon:yes stop_codon:yes gene_type:complete